nr:RNA-directed DNA polymerase, eukaryota [Tanacetum cinerariifolium]
MIWVGHWPSSKLVEEDKKPSMVLDDSCTFKSDLFAITRWFLGASSIQLKRYKDKFMSHVGVGSWFASLQQASNSFKIDERVAWINIESVPLCAKRLCNKITLEENIFESIKIIVNGKVFWIRAKEVIGWTPNFNDIEEEHTNSDDESLVDKNDGIHKDANLVSSETDVIPESIFEGKWSPNGKNLLIISVYAPQELSEKRMVWQYLNHMIDTWKGEVIVMGDFNEVSFQEERYGSMFNVQGAVAFNSFISLEGLVEVSSGGYYFTWSHKLTTKMNTWRDMVVTETNAMLKLLTKLKLFKMQIRTWVKVHKNKSYNQKTDLKKGLADIDSILDKGDGTSQIMEERMNIIKQLAALDNIASMELAQKAKVRWSIEGDENSKYFHGIINKQRNNLAIRGILVDGSWIEDPKVVKNEFLSHFKERFINPCSSRFTIDMDFPKKLFVDQMNDLVIPITKDEIKDPDVVDAVNHFYVHGFFPKGGDLVNEIQSAFIANRQILDGPFILNELIQWCKAKKKQSMIFKVDFEKASDSVRWDFLDDALKNFGFGDHWCSWIQSCLRSSRGSILVNRSLISDKLYMFKTLKY